MSLDLKYWGNQCVCYNTVSGSVYLLNHDYAELLEHLRATAETSIAPDIINRLHLVENQKEYSHEELQSIISSIAKQFASAGLLD